MNFREPGEFGEGATMLAKPRPYRIRYVCGGWLEGWAVLGTMPGYLSFGHKSIAEAFEWLKRHG